MGGDDHCDIDIGKTYRLIECRDVHFMRGAEGGLGWAMADGGMIALEGNAYILNANGKTVDTYTPQSVPAQVGEFAVAA
jgi:hypothetical protein